MNGGLRTRILMREQREAAEENARHTASKAYKHKGGKS